MSTEHPQTPPPVDDSPRHEWAHSMLAAAARTIDVTPADVVAERQRTAPRWLVPVAAAAVVAVAVGVPVWLNHASEETPSTVQVTERPSPEVRPVDTAGAVPWSDRTDAEKWTPPPGSGPYKDVDPVRWHGLAAELTVPSAADPNSELVHVVTLRNDSDTAVDLSPCPAFTQTLTADPDLNLDVLAEYTGRLNCDGLGSIAPGGTQRFVMKFRVPGNLEIDEVSLTWRLVDGPGQDAQAWLPVGQDPVERRWASRTDLPTCGEYDMTKVDEVTEESHAEALAEGAACLERSLENGKGGEFVTTMTTVEGAPVTSYVRVTRNGRLEIYWDNTQDGLGSSAWEYRSCGTVSQIEPTHLFAC